MKITLPSNVKKIIETLEQAGYEAYAVGGCVRDSILGRVPDDWDITTSAKPLQVKALFRRTFDTGIQHGTITVLMDKTGYEVTTYRIDGEYEDGRHPKQVVFTPSLEEDLKRRDFTINAMAYSEKKGLVDCFNGIGDIEKQIIRCVGDPEERFSEDALRIMRAVRFSAQLDYTIEEKTTAAICKLAPTLQKISAERVRVELTKLLMSDHPDKLRELYSMGITKVVLPEFDTAMETSQNNPHHIYTVGEHTIEALLNTPRDLVLRLTVLLHDFGKPLVKTTDSQGIDHFYGHAAKSELLAGEILRRLRFDNETIRKVTKLVFYHDLKIEQTKEGVRKAAAKVSRELFPMLLQVKHADAMGQSEYRRIEKQNNLSAIETLYQEIVNANDCISIRELAVNGNDLIQAGVTPGQEIGEILNKMLETVLVHPEYNTKEILLARWKNKNL